MFDVAMIRKPEQGRGKNYQKGMKKKSQQGENEVLRSVVDDGWMMVGDLDSIRNSCDVCLLLVIMNV